MIAQERQEPARRSTNSAADSAGTATARSLSRSSVRPTRHAAAGAADQCTEAPHRSKSPRRCRAIGRAARSAQASTRAYRCSMRCWQQTPTRGDQRRLGGQTALRSSRARSPQRPPYAVSSYELRHAAPGHARKRRPQASRHVATAAWIGRGAPCRAASLGPGSRMMDRLGSIAAAKRHPGLLQ